MTEVKWNISVHRKSTAIHQFSKLQVKKPDFYECYTPVVRNLVHKHAATKGPHAGKHKVVFQQLLVRWWCTAHTLLGQDTLQNLADGHSLVDSWQWHHILEVAAAVLQCWVDIASEQCGQQRPVLSRLQSQHRAVISVLWSVQMNVATRINCLY